MRATTGVLTGSGPNHVLDVDNVFRSGTITVNLREALVLILFGCALVLVSRRRLGAHR